MATRIEVVKGTARDVIRQVRDRNGDAFHPTDNPGPFLPSDTLACRIWPGDELATVSTPTVTWVDNDIGKFMIIFQAATTSSLALGRYRYQVTATQSGRTGVIDGVDEDDWVVVLAAPSTGVVEPSFITLDDMLEVAGWIGDLQAKSDQVGLTEQRIWATNRLISTLVQHHQYPFQQDLVSRLTYGTAPLVNTPNEWLRQQLVPLEPDSTAPATLSDRVSTQANFCDDTVSTALLLRHSVRELCAYWACYRVCAEQIEDDGGNKWERHANRFANTASNLYRSTRFEIDLGVPQTGYPSIVIDGSFGSMG